MFILTPIHWPLILDILTNPLLRMISLGLFDTGTDVEQQGYSPEFGSPHYFEVAGEV